METLATGYGLIEGPLWDDARGLLFADVMNGGVRAINERGEISDVVPKRRGVGGMAAHADGGLVLGGKEVIVQPPSGAATTLVDTSVTDVAIGFNDLTTDHAGRVWVGSLGFRVFSGEPLRPGHLHVVDVDATVHTVSDDVTLTNGLGFSPDGKQLYHSDSRRNTVRVYDVADDGISVSPWRPLAVVDGGVPDGLAVAEDGSIWVAVAHGSRVDVFEPNGALRRSIPVSLPMVTSVCFGGADLKDLYIVTGSSGGPSENCGTIYKMQADVAGLPLAAAKVKAV